MSTPIAKTPKLSSSSYTSSLRNIKLNIPTKKFVTDNNYNNAEAVKRFYDKIDLQTELQRILFDKRYCLLFREWLIDTECVENLDFWVEVELYKREVMSQEARLARAQNIIKKYFEENGDIELNLDAELKNEIEHKLKGELDSSTFNDAQLAVLRLLETSCCPRFLRSAKYKNRAKTPEIVVGSSLRRGVSLSSFWSRKPRRATSLSETVLNSVKKWNDEIVNLDRFFEICNSSLNLSPSPNSTSNSSNSTPIQLSMSDGAVHLRDSDSSNLSSPPILERQDSGKSRNLSM